MNVFDIEQEEFTEKLKLEMDEFYKTNNTEETEKRIIWDTSKAYIRGLAIQYRARRQKERNQKYNDLITTLKKEEEKHMQKKK